MKSMLAAPLGAVFFLAACSSQPQTENKTAAPVEQSKLPDTGGDAPIELSAIGEGELLALQGELGCSFTIAGQSGPALVAKADVGAGATAQGAVKIGERVQRVAGAGGFGALEKGMQLSGPGVTLAVVLLSQASSDTKSEETRFPAKLTASRPYGGERSYDGVWNCGP